MLNWNDLIRFTQNTNPSPNRRVEKTPEQWREILSDHQFNITRKKGTEMAHTGAHCTTHEPGKYHCVCCGEQLFDSGIKFESGTGWPSFTQPIAENAIKYEKDVAFGMVRIEVMCNVCDAHLGHVFPDGPEPSGLRYCVNSASIELEKEEEYESKE